MLKIKHIEDSILENARREYWGDITSYGRVVFGDVLKSAYVQLGIVFDSEIYEGTECYTEPDVKKLIVEENLNRLSRKYEDDLKQIKRNYEEKFSIQFDSDKTLVFVFNNGNAVVFDSLDYGTIAATGNWEV